MRPGGIVVINVPRCRGVFYRVAEALQRIGVASPLERLWQTDFVSPHLFYFDETVVGLRKTT